MPFNEKLFKTFLTIFLVIASAFVGYQLVSDSDLEEPEKEPAFTNTESDNSDTYEASAEVPTITDSLEGVAYGKIHFNNSFTHTKPGEYSDVYVEATGFEPGEFTIVYLRKAGTEEYIEAGGQEHTADKNGKISARFTIFEFGEYEAFLSSGSETFVSAPIVVK